MTNYGILKTPIGSHGDEQLFEKKCLPIAIILAFKHHLSEEDEKDSKKKLEAKTNFLKMSRKKPGYDNILLSKTGAKMLHDEVTTLLSNLDLPLEGPYQLHEIVPKIADSLQAQISIFSKQNEAFCTYMYPAKFDKTRRQLYLQEEEWNEKTKDRHVNVITLLQMFYKRNSFFCPSCKQILKSKQHRHICRNRRTGSSCFFCRRFLRTSDTKCSTSNSFLFCQSISENSNEKHRCPRCRCYGMSRKCLKDHMTHCGKTFKGYKCERECGKWTYTNSANPTREDVERNHVCFRYYLHQRHMFIFLFFPI